MYFLLVLVVVLVLLMCSLLAGLVAVQVLRTDSTNKSAII